MNSNIKTDARCELSKFNQTDWGVSRKHECMYYHRVLLQRKPSGKHIHWCLLIFS